MSLLPAIFAPVSRACRRLDRPRACLLAGLLAIAGCASSGLPDHAAPRGGLSDPDGVDSGDLIAYRALTRGDFLGKRPPPEFAAVASRVGATTCAHVKTTPDTQLLITGLSTGEGGFTAVVKHLRFHALMDRSCSWWNDEVAGFTPEYVLEHEQIHFALFEIKARRLNASVAEIAEKMRITAPTPEQARTLAQEELERHMQQIADELIEQNREFDEDTSLGYKPERQKAWLRRVTAELAETERWAESAGARTAAISR